MTKFQLSCIVEGLTVLRKTYYMTFHRDSDSGGKRGGKRFGGTKKPFRADKSFGGGFGSGKPIMHSATCAECGSRCQVPFKPNGSKPVLCSNCFGNDNRSGSKSFDSKRLDDKPKRFVGGDTNIADALNEINNKLDMIIRTLND